MLRRDDKSTGFEHAHNHDQRTSTDRVRHYRKLHRMAAIESALSRLYRCGISRDPVPCSHLQGACWRVLPRRIL